MAAIDTLLRKFRRNVQDYGWLSALRKSTAYLLSPLFQQSVYTIYVVDLPAAAAAEDLGGGQFEYVFLSTDDRSLIDQVERCAEWLKGEVRDRLAAGGICLAAVKGDRLAGFNLIGFHRVYIPLLKLARTFRPGKAWSEHIAVHPDFRRSGVARALRIRAFEELGRRGVRRFYGGTLRGNAPALALARSLGFREVAEVTYRSILRWKTWRYKRCPREARNVAHTIA